MFIDMMTRVDPSKIENSNNLKEYMLKKEHIERINLFPFNFMKFEHGLDLKCCEYTSSSNNLSSLLGNNIRVK